MPAGAVWKYLDVGVNPGTAWQALSFDDSAWASGPAQLGYGDGDERTVVSFGSDPNFKYVTTYFRHAFTLDDPAGIAALTVRLLRDDGGVVYLNGVEIFRSNMPDGFIDYWTLSATTIPNSDESVFFPSNVDPALLVAGTNVLAVEIHQANYTSSDLSFDLNLVATAASGPPVITLQPQNQIAGVGGTATFRVKATGAAPLGYQWNFAGVEIPGATNAALRLTGVTAENEGRYWVMVTNALDAAVSDKASLSLVNLTGDLFQITSLSADNAVTVEHLNLTGDDRGGIAASFGDLLVTGDGSTARFSLSDLLGGASLGQVYDSLVGDLRTGSIYLLANRATPLSSGGTVDTLLEMDATTGTLTGHTILLSTNVDLNGCSGCMGVFSGFGRIVLHNGSRAFTVRLPSGQVLDHGPMATPNHQSSENWAYWGVAEYFDDTPWIVYVRDSQTIVRTRVPDGLTLPVSTFTNLSDMASITVSPVLNRWYFHHQYTSQFRSGNETVGFADAAIAHEQQPQPPAILVQPRDRSAPAGSNATFTVVALGYPLDFQWQFNGQDILGATNRTLTLTGVSAAQVGLYSVNVGNDLGSATSASALLNVVSGGNVVSRVAVFGADPPATIEDVRQKIRGTALFDQVDGFELWNGLPVPPLEQLQQYDAVLVFSDYSFSDPVAFGNALADYVDDGGGVVLATFAFDGSSTDIRGRLRTDGYLPFTTGFNSSGGLLSLVPDNPSHPLLDGVASFNGGSSSYLNSSLALASGAELVAHWSNGEPLVGVKPSSGAFVVGLNFYPPSSDLSSSFWDARTDGARLMANALTVAGRGGGSTVPGVPPGLRAQPANVAVLQGLDASFSVTCYGSPALAYQWLSNSAPIANATNRLLKLTNVQPSAGGGYAVIITNAYGSVTSQIATLTVVPTRGVAGFYTDFNTASTGLVASIVSAQFTPLRIEDISAFDFSRLSVLLLNATSDQPSPALRRRLPEIQEWVDRGGRLVIHQRYFNSEALTANPLLLGTRGIHFTNVCCSADVNISPGPSNLVVAGPHGTLNNASFDGGEQSYQAIAGSSTLPPGTTSIFSAGPAVNQVVAFAYGLGAGLVYHSTLWLDWYLDYSSSSVGNLMRTVYAPNVIEYAAAFTASGPPAILASPESLTTTVGSEARFLVSARGQPVLRYQWLLNGAPLSGATNNPLRLSNVSSNDAGAYSVIVSNGLGFVTSAVATLKVVPQVSVAVFHDPRYVYTGLNTPADNVQAMLAQLGHTVRPFTNLLSALTNDVLLFPPFGPRGLAPDLDSATRSLLQAYVTQGGLLIVQGGYANVDLLNSVFEVSLGVNGCYGGLELNRTPQAAGTPFADAPLTIAGNSCLYLFYPGSLPAASLSIYTNQYNGSVVTLFPYGAGTLLHLGWTWDDAAPIGQQDGGWSSVLARAVQARGVISGWPAVSTPLVTAGSAWRFLDTGTNQGPTWRGTNFDDSSWASGPAQLGYGDGDEATVVGFGPDATNKFITTYFRHKFTVADASVVPSLTLRLLRDDGAAVYLNGVEIVRDCLPADASFDAYAYCTISGADENQWLWYTVDPGLLRTGTNLLAVEIHQADPTSSDISFDLELSTIAPAAVPFIRTQPAGHTVPAGATVVLDVVAVGALPLKYQWRLDDQSIPGATNAILLLSGVTANQSGRYSVVVSNALGSVVSRDATVSVVTLGGGTFRVASLSTNNALVVDDSPFAGDDRGGIAASAERLFYSGDNGTARFVLADLSGGTNLGVLYDSMVSDLGTERAYSLASSTDPSDLLNANGGVATTLLEIDGATGQFTGSSVRLSQAIDLSGRYGQVGLFAGLGRILVHDGTRAWNIEVPSGRVVELGPVSVPSRNVSENWAYWGLAEFFGGDVWLVYVRDSQAIVRTRVSDGFTEAVATFNNLSDMASITVSLPFNRWYFHHQSSSQFSPFYETTGFADAAFVSSAPPVAPTIVKPPEDQAVAASGTAVLRVSARGTGPLNYQWLFEGTPLAGATNSTLRLSQVTTNQSGHYSVVVSNVLDSTLSSAAMLTVIPLGGETFKIASLSNNAVVVDDYAVAGYDRGAIAVSGQRAFYSGSGGTARFDLADLSGGANSGVLIDGLISDLGAETVYALANGSQANGSNVITPIGGVVTALLEVDGRTGGLTGASLALSQPIDLGNRYGQIGYFAGLGRIVLTDGVQAWNIDTASGRVLSLGAMTVPQHAYTEIGAYWGVAEFFGGSIWLVYVRDSQTIVRTRVPDGLTETVANFLNLSDMAAITVSRPFNRWYFHHQYSSEFSSFYGTLGFADAAFISSAPPIAPSVVKPPLDQSVGVGGAAEFKVVARGTAPLDYQWMLEGTAVPGATNSTLTLTNISLGQAGHYSVTVSNAAGTATSTAALLRVIPSVTLAVFDDPAFVYTGGGAFDHSDSVQASLRRLGHQATPFTSISQAAGGSAPLLFPALEAGDLAPTLPQNTIDALQVFVARGGVLIVHGANNDCGRATRVLNAVFGYAIQCSYPGAPFARTAQAAGTAFAAGPDFLPLNSYSPGLLTSSLPPGASAIYGDMGVAGVALFRFGSGKIIYLGWNWSDAVPLGRQDGGWLTVLGSAIEETAPPAPHAPEILASPQSQVVIAGASLQFRVVATGYPLSYQWRFNGQPLGGATNYVLRLNSVTTNRAGVYSVVVSNALGSVTSSDAALNVVAPLTVAVFDDPQYVDTSGGSYAESDNVQATLRQLGHAVSTFTTLTSAVTNQVLLFPEFENGDPTYTLDTATRAALQNFVWQGGLVIVQYTSLNFLNTVFGLSLYSSGGSSFPRTAQVIGTPFADDPPSLPGNNATTPLATASLPFGARNLYGDTSASAIALIPYGGGNIIYMGWDWFDAAPIGTQDGGWVETLGSAVLARVALFATPPVITVQPQGQDVLAGQDVTLVFGAYGSAPLQSQWFHDGQPLFGATSPALVMPAVTTNQSGAYHVVVSNSAGSVTSEVATLVVRPSRGTVGYFTDNNPTLTGPAASIQQASFTPLPIYDISTYDLTRLDMLMIDEAGGGSPSAPLLSRLPDIEAWVNNGGKLIVHDRTQTGSSNPFLVGAPATVLTYNPGENIEILAPGDNLVAAGPHGPLDGASLDGGGSSYYGYAQRDTLPARSLPILGADLNTNDVVAFSYGLGAGSVYYAAIPLDYFLEACCASVWARFKTNYTPNVIEHVAAFSVTGPPALLADLRNAGALVGGTATLRASANGSTPLFYQWFFNGAPILDATNETLVLSNVTTAHAGGYSVIVSNSLGTAVSALSILSVSEARPFRIVSLTANSSQIVDHDLVTGHDRGGIGLSATHVYYTGDAATGRFSATNLTGGTALAQRYDALVSNLRTETLYTLASDTDLINGPNGYVTALIKLNGSTGDLTTNRVVLSTPILLGVDTGIFASYDAAVLHTGGRVYRIELPSGLVQDLGAMGSFAHSTCENWAYWGVAEFFGGSVYLDYVRDSQTIARTRAPDGATTNLATFTNLSDMCSFTVSLARNRWYYHYEGGAQFGGAAETLGYATASFDRPPQTTTPANRVINEDSSTGPIQFLVQDESPLNLLVLSASSSNPGLLPASNIVFVGTSITRTVTLTPAPDQFGTSVVTMTLTDAIGQSTNRSFILTVNPVNDGPTFTPGPSQLVRENAGPQTVRQWATNISPGPANEAEQSVAFTVSNDDSSLFAVPPAITPDGTLTYTPAPHTHGAASVSVVLRDSGGTSFSGVDASPASQFTIAVAPATNSPPGFSPIPTQTAYVLTPLVVRSVVVDPDIPANAFTFRLEPGAPAGARINPNSGEFIWTPTREQAPSSNVVTVVVTDDGVPPLSGTNSFRVMVGDFLELSLGAAVLQAGQTGRVALTLSCSAGVTNVGFVLEAPEERLMNFAFQAPAPEIAEATLSPAAPGRFVATLRARTGQTLLGTALPAYLSFSARSNQASAFIPLTVSGVTATQGNGSPVPQTLASDGRVVIIGATPLLEAGLYTNDRRALVLYGNPGVNYLLESTPNLASPAAWLLEWQGPLTNLVRVFDLGNTNGTIFYRARE